jgi:hypothetical protein
MHQVTIEVVDDPPSSTDVTVEDVRRILGIEMDECKRPWYQGPIVAYPVAFLISGLFWWGVVAAVVWLRINAGSICRAVASNLAWFWNSGPSDDPWLGPARWGIVVSAAMVAWCLGMWIVGRWRSRK